MTPKTRLYPKSYDYFEYFCGAIQWLIADMHETKIHRMMLLNPLELYFAAASFFQLSDHKKGELVR